MTYFWRYCTPSGVAQLDSIGQKMVFKPIGTGTMAWWGRCDLCYWSGPSTSFVVAARGEEQADLCENCADDPHLVQHLVDDGWCIR